VFRVKEVFKFITELKKQTKKEEIGDIEGLVRSSEEEGMDTPEEMRAFLLMDIPRTLSEIPFEKLEEELLKMRENYDSVLYAKMTGLPLSEE
jgi:predicted transposase YdaD